MTDSIQKIIDDMKATAESANYHDFPQEYKHLMIFTERLEALQKQPVAWFHESKDEAIADSWRVGLETLNYTIPLIRAD